MVALQWLRKTDPMLIKIVKTEYSTDLRQNVQLAQLVPRIALNIDSLLERYASGSITCNKLTTQSDLASVDDIAINRVSSNSSRGARKDNRSFNNQRKPANGRGSGPFCPGCYYLGQQLDVVLHVKHFPSDCPRRSVTVKLLQIEDSNNFEDDNIGDYRQDVLTNSTSTFQVEHRNDQEHQDLVKDIFKQNSPTQNLNISESFHLTENCSNVDDTSFTRFNFSEVSKQSDISQPTCLEPLSLQAAVRRLANRRNVKYGEIRHEKSPMVPVVVNNNPTVVTIDEGSEINCVDEHFAIKSKIRFVPTKCKAYAAGTSEMKLTGQTLEDVILHVQGVDTNVSWNLGKAIIVKISVQTY